MIYILTGEIRTGKTTALLNWSKNRNDVDGLLCPDNLDGKRYFLKIKTQEKFPLEVDDASNVNIVSVGSYKFLESAFETANDYLIEISNSNEFTYLIIDELGKLELKNEGLHTSAERLIPQYISNKKQHLILVVRSSLLEYVLKHYEIQNYKLISIENLRENSLA